MPKPSFTPTANLLQQQHPAFLMDEADWIATEATVTSCRFQFASMSNLAFGFSTRKKFRITFDYYAHGRLYSDKFQSATAIPQNTRIPLTYNPLHPQENGRTHQAASPPAASAGKLPFLAVAVTGSILLSLAWLLVLHGCH